MAAPSQASGGPAPIPVQLRPDVYFPDPQSGATPAEFLNLLLARFGSPSDRSADGAAAMPAVLAGHTGAGAALPLLDVSGRISTLNAAQRHRLNTASRALVDALRDAIPVPAGETVTSITATCLEATVGRHPPGTVVVVHTTDRATRYLLLPFVRVDLATGAPRLTLPALSGAGDGPRVGAATTSRDAEAAFAASVTGKDILKGIVQLGGTLSFALPAPWGAIASGVFSLFSLLLGSGTPDPFAEVVSALENYLEERDIEQRGRTINDFLGGTNGMQTQLDVLKETLSSDQTVYINQTLLPMINAATDAGSNANVYAASNALHDTTAQLVAAITNGTRQDFYAAKAPSMEDTLDMALLGTTALLMGLKFKIQLYAALASLAYKNADARSFNQLTGAWLDAYAVYAININGEGDGKTGAVARHTTLLNDALAARLSLVGAPYSVGWDEKTNDEGSIAYIEVGWGFTDAELEDPAIEAPPMDPGQPTLPQHYVADDPPEGCCGHQTAHPDQVVAMRATYVAGLTSDFLTHRQSIIDGWAASLSQWKQHLPPQPPTANIAPTIDAKAIWMGETPNGANWVNGNAVSYAVAFANSLGTSQYGDFGPWVEITTQSFPTVTVPTDPLFMATSRWIYRRFRSNPTPQLLAVIPDNTSPTFVDNHT